jgi:hypothetical protein
MISVLPTITISTIFLAWNASRRERLRRQRLLHERVAYMLWVAANHDKAGPDRDEGGDDSPPDDDLDRRRRAYKFLHRGEK